MDWLSMPNAVKKPQGVLNNVPGIPHAGS